MAWRSHRYCPEIDTKRRQISLRSHCLCSTHISFFHILMHHALSNLTRCCLYLSPETNCSGVSSRILTQYFFAPHLYIFATLSFPSIVEWINQPLIFFLTPSSFFEQNCLGSSLTVLCSTIVRYKCYLNPLSLSLKAAETIGASDSCREETVFKKISKRTDVRTPLPLSSPSPPGELFWDAAKFVTAALKWLWEWKRPQSFSRDLIFCHL